MGRRLSPATTAGAMRVMTVNEEAIKLHDTEKIDGTEISILRKKDGAHAVDSFGCVDQDYVVGHAKIDSTGGGW